MSENSDIQVLIQNVSELTSSVNTLVNINSARIEREKQQEKENKNFAGFMVDNLEPLARLKRTQSRYDKWGDKIGFLVLIVVLTSAGFNFLQ